ncbi:Sulfhydrogenase 2 subunit gamma [Gammaproteobacteria bacterium]
MLKLFSYYTTLFMDNNINYIPFSCEIVLTENLTPFEKLFRFKRLDGQSFGHKPGQFMQLSIVGIGEAPISVSSSPTRGDYLEMGVRKIGTLTAALHDLKVGAKIGMRGPFGTCFPTADLKSKNLILIAGGCGLAPLRSLIQYVEDRSDEFGKVTILYGAKSPQDLMYKEEIKNWQTSKKVSFYVTVDAAAEKTSWSGNVGLITKLIPPLEIDVNNTVAVICGPPIMYKFVIIELKKKGLAEKDIVVSLERHMKCGVGKCGHCTIEHLYCCIDGPVFWLSQIAAVPGAI